MSAAQAVALVRPPVVVAAPAAAVAAARRGAAAPAAPFTGQHRLFEGVLQLLRRERLRQLDVGLDLQRLAELLEAHLALLEADDGDDAEMDMRARADRVLVQPRARAQLQRLLEQSARRLVILLVVGVDRSLVQARDLV